MAIDPEILLSHKDFIHSLARRLVLDEASADDLTQQAFLAAVERPPQSEKSIRGWIRRVLRNVSVTATRADRSRREREQAVAKRESFPSTAEISEKEAIRRRVVDEVQALPEPYRHTILLRFYEGKTPRDIAESLSLPLETVRTRLKRGLAKLRQRLDREFGDRSSWCLALAPLAGVKVGGVVTAGGAVGAVGKVSGGILMASKVKVGLVAAVVVVAGLVVWTVFPNDNDAPDRTVLSALEEESLLDRERATSTELEESGGGDAITLLEENVTTKTILPAGLFFSGQVVDMVSGIPINPYRLYVWEKPRQGENVQSSPPFLFDEAIRNPEGKFNIPLRRGGGYEVRIYSPSHLDRCDEIKITGEERLTDVQYRLDPGMIVSGIVLNAETREPVSGAIVGSNIKTHLYQILIINRPLQTEHAVSDAAGCFHLGGLDCVRQNIVAIHPDFSEGHILLEPDEDGEIVILLERGLRVFGTVYGDNGEPVEGIVVSFSGPMIPFRRPVLSQKDGTYRSPPVLPGRVSVSASQRSGSKTGVFSSESKIVEVADSDMRVDFGPSATYVTWRGRAIDYDGMPIPNLEISLKPDRKYSWEIPPPQRTWRFSCDQNGNFEAGKLPVGRYQVELEFPRRITTVDWRQVTFEESGVIKKDINITGSVIRGVVLEGDSGEPLTGGSGYINVEGYDSSDSSWKRHSSHVQENGSFIIRGLSPGDYTIRAGLQGHPPVEVTAPSIGVNQFIDDFEIVVPEGGRLQLSIVNRKYPGLKTFKQSFFKGGEEFNGPRSTFNADGIFRHDDELEAGNWKAVLYFPGIGLTERNFAIVRGKTTKVLVDCENLTFFDKTVSVQGTIVHWDETPATNVSLRFPPYGDDVPLLKSDDVELKGISDDQGRFEIAGFRPGKWFVYVYVSESASLVLPELHIPAFPTDPLPVRLVIPRGGVIRGTVVQREAGLTVGAQRPLRGGCMLNIVGGKGLPQSCTLQERGFFEFEYVPEGAYRMEIHTDATFEYQSEPFCLRVGQILDLGEISLAPAGFIEMEIVDQDGEYVSGAKVEIEDKSGRLLLEQKNAPCRWSSKALPLSEIRVRVFKEGYRTWERAVTLKAGTENEIKAMIQLK